MKEHAGEREKQALGEKSEKGQARPTNILFEIVRL